LLNAVDKNKTILWLLFVWKLFQILGKYLWMKKKGIVSFYIIFQEIFQVLFCLLWLQNTSLFYVFPCNPPSQVFPLWKHCQSTNQGRKKQYNLYGLQKMLEENQRVLFRMELVWNSNTLFKYWLLLDFDNSILNANNLSHWVGKVHSKRVSP